MAPNLIPRASEYVDADYNVLLIGPHGTGKTESILQIVKEKGLKFKYFSCAVLDPWTDLTGVPFPKDIAGEDRRELEMVRPRSINEAEFIFFDELNRADAKTMNAVLEIIQFKSINGEPLPNLRCCWAAINPPGEDYAVEDMDPALLDRFHVSHRVDAKPSVQYMSEKFPVEIARALKSWWDGHDKAREDSESYVSPRRLVYIGDCYMKTGAVKPALPPFGTFDVGKLEKELAAARKKISGTFQGTTSGGIGDGQADFDYTPDGLLGRKDEVIKYLKENPSNIDTHAAVLNAIKGIPSKKLAQDFAGILSAILPAQLEGFYSKWPPAKRERLERELLAVAQEGRAGEVAEAYRILTSKQLPA